MLPDEILRRPLSQFRPFKGCRIDEIGPQGVHQTDLRRWELMLGIPANSRLGIAIRLIRWRPH